MLGAVQNEFAKYNAVVDKLANQLSTAANSVESLGKRTRAMSRKLRGVETLPDGTPIAALLGFDGEDVSILPGELGVNDLTSGKAPIVVPQGALI